MGGREMLIWLEAQAEVFREIADRYEGFAASRRAAAERLRARLRESVGPAPHRMGRSEAAVSMKKMLADSGLDSEWER